MLNCKRDYIKQPPLIFIAVGHGGPDPGAVHGALREADCNLAMAMQLRADLMRHGVQVKLSRYGDEEDRLQDEIAECNQYAPDFALALHTNAGGGSGFEVYYQTAPWKNCQYGARMASLFDGNVKKYLGVATRGCKTNQQLGWLKRVQAPCILVESFFIDGPRADWYSSIERIVLLSQAYTRAILEFFGIAYRENGILQLRIRVVNADLQTAEDYICQAVLIEGHYFVHLRQICKALGKGVYYDAEQKTPILYPPDVYAESEFQNGLLKLSDFPTRAERILAGISTEEALQYNFDEYDRADDGTLLQTLSIC